MSMPPPAGKPATRRTVWSCAVAGVANNEAAAVAANWRRVSMCPSPAFIMI